MSESTVIRPNKIIDREYISFFEYKIPERKTKYWTVKNKKHGTRLGDIEWYSAWRRYCFFTVDGIVFDEKCLLDILKFLHDQNRLHKNQLIFKKICGESEVK